MRPYTHITQRSTDNLNLQSLRESKKIQSLKSQKKLNTQEILFIKSKIKVIDSKTKATSMKLGHTTATSVSGKDKNDYVYVRPKSYSTHKSVASYNNIFKNIKSSKLTGPKTSNFMNDTGGFSSAMRTTGTSHFYRPEPTEESVSKVVVLGIDNESRSDFHY
jgi:hypothetical protein